jgi:hypothetical protein
MVPVVDLPGAGTAAMQSRRETGADWLARQDAETQRAILGKGGYEAYQAGTPLSRFARVEHDPDWGATLRVARLSEVA